LSEPIVRIGTDFSGIDALLINTFFKVFRFTLSAAGCASDIKKGTLSLVQPASFSGHPLIVFSITGEVTGAVVLQLPDQTARNLASGFLLGLPVENFDDISRNTLAEFCLRMNENIRAEMEDLGHITSVTHDCLFGDLFSFPKPTRLVRMPLATPFGPLELFINLHRTNGI
jgi:CheY-specific phosphatase CheX